MGIFDKQLFLKERTLPRPNLSAARQICRNFLAAAFFAERRAATSPSRPRRNENLCELLCHQFTARLVSAGDGPLRRNSDGALKPFLWFGILRRPVRRFARRAVPDAAQVLVRRQDFRGPLGSLPACGSSTSSVTFFCVVRALRGRELPSVRRNAPEVCRKTQSIRR
jgi:hypothetical protein